MRDSQDVRDLRLRSPADLPHLRRLHLAAEEDAHFEMAAPRPHEEVARVARKHDARARRVDALLAERHRGLAQPLPCVQQIFREILRERRLGRRPAVVRLAFLDPLLAVIALASLHSPIVATPCRLPYSVLDSVERGASMKKIWAVAFVAAAVTVASQQPARAHRDATPSVPANIPVPPGNRLFLTGHR